jgi:hypothetical protein
MLASCRSFDSGGLEMLRASIVMLVALVATDTACAADQSAVQRKAARSATQLPPGLPRAHYNYRTTITEPTTVVVAPDPDVLISSVPVPLVLPGQTSLPGYYGRPFDYYNQGPYYGDPYPPYFVRLPYACGVLGYC